MTSQLEDLASAFAADLEKTLRSVLPGAPAVVAVQDSVGKRFVVRGSQVGEPDSPLIRVPLTVGGEDLAVLTVRFFVSWDSSGRYLAVHQSDVKVTSSVENRPLLRLDYRRDMHSVPSAHWQVHAERGAFTHLLTRAHMADSDRVRRPWELSALHIPVGGERFRPCLEDVLEMLVRELGVDAREGWEEAIGAGRESWRRRQVRTVTRDAPGEAAAALRELGFAVEAPEGWSGLEHVEALRRW